MIINEYTGSVLFSSSSFLYNQVQVNCSSAFKVYLFFDLNFCMCSPARSPKQKMICFNRVGRKYNARRLFEGDGTISHKFSFSFLDLLFHHTHNTGNNKRHTHKHSFNYGSHI